MVLVAERSYPRVMNNWSNPPVSCPDDEWVSQREAGKLLGVSLGRVGWRILCGHLVPAQDSRGAAGVTRSSIAKDQEWLAAASWWAKAFRVLKGLARGF